MSANITRNSTEAQRILRRVLIRLSEKFPSESDMYAMEMAFAIVARLLYEATGGAGRFVHDKKYPHRRKRGKDGVLV
jgi:uncharacterized membrane protein YphA (DoxX/SURF4 family)